MSQNRTLIATTPLAGVRPLAWQSIQAITCHAQLASLLETSLSPAHAAFLAEPQIDQTTHSADWYTQAQGTTQRLVDLPVAEQTALRQQIAALATPMQTLAAELQKAADSNSKMAGALLELALSYPSDDCLYRVGTQPVLTCWGCAPGNAAAAPESLTRVAMVAPTVTPPPSASAVPPLPVTPTPAAPTSAPSASSAQEPAPAGTPKTATATAPAAAAPIAATAETSTQKSQRPWWILFFLLGFLLCALIMPWLLPRMGLPAISLDALPGGGGSSATAPPPPPTPAQKEALSGLGSSQDAEKALRDELKRLRATLTERLAACPPPQKEAKVEPPPPPPPPPPPEVKPEPVPEPEVAALPPPAPKPEPPPLPEKKEQPKNLKIPDDQTDLSFLEGCWLAEVGKLINTDTGLPISIKFCFDNKGNGVSLLQEFDAQGRKISECKGRADARFIDKGMLIIDDRGTVMCPDGRNYVRTEAFCENKGDIAVCNRPVPPPNTWNSVPFTRTTR